MKFRAFLASSALITANLNSVLVAPAFADVIPTPSASGPNSGTLSVMELQCDNRALAHGANWKGEVDMGSIVGTLISGPTEVNGTRVKDMSTVVGTGVFTPGVTYIDGDPYRIGGSVNMFGDRYASSGSWSDSEYEYDADFLSTFSYAFNCTMAETVTTPVQGYYRVAPDAQGNEEAHQQSCAAFTALGPTWTHWGNDHAQCEFVKTADAGTEDQPRPDEAGVPEQETQTDNLRAFEDHGGTVQAEGGPFFLGQAVICISPSKPTPGGTWRQQNGYTGDKCKTDYFKVAPWGSGSQTSQGTYISVPNYHY